jgi:hypothetical protein
MAEVTANMIKDLRERTGAGMSDCKKALVECDADMDKAIDYLRAKGLAKAAKKAGREATEGAVVSYIHGGGRIGVLIEVNCETDFVARNDDFVAFTKDVAMQVAAMGPQFVRRDEVAEDVDRARARRAGRQGGRERQARGDRAEDGRGPAQQVAQGHLPARPAVREEPRPDHRSAPAGADREDRREHQDPPLRALRAGRGPREEEGRLRAEVAKAAGMA